MLHVLEDLSVVFNKSCDGGGGVVHEIPHACFHFLLGADESGPKDDTQVLRVHLAGFSVLADLVKELDNVLGDEVVGKRQLC